MLTHDKLFNGAEADTVIFVSSAWGSGTLNIRSGVTRAVSHFCLITAVDSTDVEKLSQTFNVQDLRSDKDKVTTSTSSKSSDPYSLVHYGVTCDGCQMEDIRGDR